MFDLRSEGGADFTRQRGTREGGRERQAKEAACAKALGQVGARAIWSTEGECDRENGARRGGVRRGKLMQGFGSLFQ